MGEERGGEEKGCGKWEVFEANQRNADVQFFIS